MSCFDFAFLTKIGLVVAVLAVTALINYIAHKIIKRAQPLARKNIWLRTLFETTTRFSTWLIWGIGILFALELLIGPDSTVFPQSTITRLRKVFMIAAIAWAFTYFKNRFEETLLKSSEKSKDANFRALLSVGSRLASIAIFTISGLMILEVFGLPLSTLLAVGGLGGLAVSWAAKDVISNFFGGLMIYINRPFIIGDWIKSPNKNFEGVVENIGWYMTQIRTFERRPTYIPNAIITEAIIENPGRMYNRRIRTTIGLRYEDVATVKPITDEIKQMLDDHPGIDHDQFLMVHFIDFGPSSLDVEIYAFTKTTGWSNYRDVQQDVLLKVSDIVKKHGADIAFPTTTVHIEKE